MYKVRFICIVIKGSLTGQPNVDEVLHPHVLQIYQTVENIFSSNKTMPAYLQYAKELFASWSFYAPLTNLPGSDPSLIGHPWDILGPPIHDRIPSLPSCLIS